jgi:hypothetical protein
MTAWLPNLEQFALLVLMVRSPSLERSANTREKLTSTFAGTGALPFSTMFLSIWVTLLIVLLPTELCTRARLARLPRAALPQLGALQAAILQLAATKAVFSRLAAVLVSQQALLP